MENFKERTVAFKVMPCETQAGEKGMYKAEKALFNQGLLRHNQIERLI